MKLRQRKSIRLKGYDYSQPGSYFITICTQDGRCVFGKVDDGIMKLSESGGIVERCWNEIPQHFKHVRTHAFQIMPNHIHGIIEIRRGEVSSSDTITATETESRRGEVTSPLRITYDDDGDDTNAETAPLRKMSLGSVVAYFKYQATKYINQTSGTTGKKVFQRNYYDHIIRSDREHFFIARYIEMNPLLWYLDSNNPAIHELPMVEFERALKEKHGLDDYALRFVIETELEYRQWEEEL